MYIERQRQRKTDEREQMNIIIVVGLTEGTRR
jgi:hypothetical protein